MLLQMKLTGLFVVFGLLIGLLSSFTSTVTTAKMIADTFLNSETNPVGKMLSKYPHDWIYAVFTQKASSDARNLLKDIIPPEFKNSISLAFYYKKKNGTVWYVLKDTAHPEQPVQKEEDKELLSNLTSAIVNRIVDSQHTFFNFSRSHTLFFNATSLGDENKYVVKTTINRKNMLDYIFSKRKEGIPYIIITLFFSFLLGLLFSRSITKPLRKLSGKALAFSEGDFAVRFETSRKDDIGLLSRSLDQLAWNISYRISTIQTMNRIDKAVNSSLSRTDLLTNIIKFISDQFPGSLLMVLEKKEHSYTLTAATPSGVFPRSLHIPFETLSGSFLKNNAALSDLDKTILSQINERLQPEMKKKYGISIPLKQADTITGLLVFIRNTLTSRDREALALLADQVGVALLSLKEYTARHRLYDGVVYALSRSIDAKSPWTSGHSERVALFSVKLAGVINLGTKTIDTIKIAALLHDIGKLGISEEILNKPGKLLAAEYALVKEHPVIGYKIVEDLPDFELVKYAVRHHHERWDGSGYPDGLFQDAIPIIARIISLSDVWDALTADRPYRKGFSRKEALGIMKEERGRLFDPSLLDTFLKLI